MKKILFILLFLLCGRVYSQDFEMIGLTNSVSINGSDIFMFSTSGGDLYKFTYTNLLGNLDDEAFTWTAAHGFSGTVTLNTTVAGNPVFSGDPDFNGDPDFAGDVDFAGGLTAVGLSQFNGLTWFASDSTSITNGKFVINAGATGRFDGAVTTRGTMTLEGINNFTGTNTFDGTIRTNEIAYIDSNLNLDDILTIIPDEIAMASGGQGYASTGSFIIFDGHVDGTSETSSISATGIADGTLMVVMCDEADGHGFLLTDGVSMHLYGGLDLTMSAGDMVLLMYRDSDFYQASPILRQLTGSTPQVTALTADGAQDVAVTNLFMVLTGNAIVPSTIDDFTGVKNDGTILTILDHPSDASGFEITNGTDIVNIGGRDISMTAGDVIQYVCRTEKWYEIDSPDPAGTYGTTGFADSSLAIAMAEDVYSPITNPTHTLYTSGINVGDLNWRGDSVQVITAGNYEINWDLSFKGANTDIYHTTIFVNNVKQSGKGETKRDMTGTSIGVASGNTILTISATHWINLRIMNEANGNDATVSAGNINITKK